MKDLFMSKRCSGDHVIVFSVPFGFDWEGEGGVGELGHGGYFVGVVVVLSCEVFEGEFFFERVLADLFLEGGSALGDFGGGDGYFRSSYFRVDGFSGDGVKRGESATIDSLLVNIIGIQKGHSHRCVSWTYGLEQKDSLYCRRWLCISWFYCTSHNGGLLHISHNRLGLDRKGILFFWRSCIRLFWERSFLFSLLCSF
jgi:hypothetical protein